jgi:hypothetical protein
MARGFIDKAGKAIKKFFSKKKGKAGKLVPKGIRKSTSRNNSWTRWTSNPKDAKVFMDAAKWNKANTAIGMDPKLQKLFKTRNKFITKDAAAFGTGASIGIINDKERKRKAKHGGHIVPGKFLRQGDLR